MLSRQGRGKATRGTSGATKNGPFHQRESGPSKGEACHRIDLLRSGRFLTRTDYFDCNDSMYFDRLAMRN
jgi:hypothetical protein